MGILLLHSIEHFNFYVFPDNGTQSEWLLAMNQKIWDTMFFIFGSKAYGIFAVLFGFTFHLQVQKQQKSGVDFGSRFLWRMFILFGFGWLNSILFPGEVLLLYAILGPFLFVCRKWSDKGMLIVAIVFLLQPLEIYQFLRSFYNPEYQVPNYQVGMYWQAMMDYIREGQFLSMAQNSWIGFKMTFFWSLENGRISQTVGLFSIGVFLGRKRMFNKSKESTKRWLVVFACSILLFFAFQYLHLHWLEGIDEQYKRPLGILLNAWKNLFQLSAMVSIFCILYYTKEFRFLTVPLRSYGRMSLSNYMLQSLVGGLLFYTYGMNLAEKVNVTYSLLIGIGLLFMFVGFCNLWMTRFKQGPMEMLWHRLTWMPFPLKKER